ncbi:MAG: hypothetical protein N2201_02000 [candidate division WOR-3 bacterium]|nr:hypothetical protein [candidate division WOR-3 bacterium]
MKYVEIEEIWKKFPNKYLALLKAAKESRKILEAQKTPSVKVPHSEIENEDNLTSTKSSITQETSRQRARNIKDMASPKTKPDVENVAQITITEKVVIAEKEETNPYIAGLKRVLRSKE